MESLYGSTAILLCCTLCLPAPVGAAQQIADASQPARSKARPEYVSAQLRGDERILQALNRFTFGPRPGDLEAVRNMGLDRWFEEQLHPATIDESRLNARLAEFPAMQWSMEDLFYRMPSNPILRQAVNGKVQIPADGPLHAVYENQIYRIEARRAAKAEKNAAASNSAPCAANDGANSGANGQPAAALNCGAPSNAQASGPSGSVQPGTSRTKATPSAAGQTAMSASAPAQAMDAMPASAALAASPAAPVEPDRDETAIQQILSLAPEQRVLRLESMQPAEFESFIKSLRSTERQALIADLNPDLREAVGDLENPEQTVERDMCDDAGGLTLVTMSEFGRTARENGTGGTDHGHANAMFVLGGSVKGGKVYGRWPGLENEQLNEDRDLALTTDFRQVLGEVATQTLGAENLEMVFPGARLNRGSFLRLV